MTADDDVEVIFSDLCADVEIYWRFLTVEIHKTDIDPSLILENVNEFGTSTVLDDPFMADGLARQHFEQTVKKECLTAFLTMNEKRQFFH